MRLCIAFVSRTGADSPGPAKNDTMTGLVKPLGAMPLRFSTNHVARCRDFRCKLWLMHKHKHKHMHTSAMIFAVNSA